jgi:probable rRNA maturation factor
VLKGELREVFENRCAEISIVLVGAQKIRRINKEYRKIDSATDVLSFGNDNMAAGKGALPQILGELVICPQVVKSDARQAGTAAKREMAWVVIHGILHLLGYDHETGETGAKAMREKEEFYLSKLNFKSAKLKAQSVK